jgi:DNA-binding MarR family transcriptional regulator
LWRVKDQAQSLSFDLGEFLPFQLSVIAGRVFQRVMEDAGLQVPEWRIMMALPANQPCSSHDLCILTAMDAARVSRAQRRLEDLELISVIRDKIDRRRLVVRLSVKGMEEVLRLRTAARRRKRPSRFARARGSRATSHRHRRDLRTDLTARPKVRFPVPRHALAGPGATC